MDAGHPSACRSQAGDACEASSVYAAEACSFQTDEEANWENAVDYNVRPSVPPSPPLRISSLQVSLAHALLSAAERLPPGTRCSDPALPFVR